MSNSSRKLKKSGGKKNVCHQKSVGRDITQKLQVQFEKFFLESYFLIMRPAVSTFGVCTSSNFGICDTN